MNTKLSEQQNEDEDVGLQLDESTAKTHQVCLEVQMPQNYIQQVTNLPWSPSSLDISQESLERFLSVILYLFVGLLKIQKNHLP